LRGTGCKGQKFGRAGWSNETPSNLRKRTGAAIFFKLLLQSAFFVLYFVPEALPQAEVNSGFQPDIFFSNVLKFITIFTP